jgi:cell volume regulation protein A
VELTNQFILLGALFLLGSIVASAVSARVGAPLLLVFLVIGMLAGEDGPGGIPFHDVQSAHLIGTLALAIILFDGGLRTRASSFRVGLWPAATLATVGVVLTAGVTGLFAVWALGLGWLEGLLIGAIVGSTDAAAVFALLHVRGMELKQRVAATLEIESGGNDPMAVFLTIALVEVLAAGGDRLGWEILGDLAMQTGLGALIGVGAGYALVLLLNRLTLQTGLYPLLAMAGGLAAFGLTTLAGGSGFLAIYLAGIVLGNRRLHAAQNILRVHDGLAWLAQIGMFLVLGLLVTPSALLPQAGAALAVAAVLMLVARPLAVWVSLLPFHFPWREQLFIAWVGLRGAVPIVLALFPLLAGLGNAGLFFNVAFFVVLVSLLVQGWTVAPAARLLGLEIPANVGPLQRVNLEAPQEYGHELVGYEIPREGGVAGLAPARLDLPEGAHVAAVIRDARVRPPGEIETLKAGDCVYLFTATNAIEELNGMFAAHLPAGELKEQQFFGEFVLDGEATLAAVATVYGLALSAEQQAQPLADFMAEAFHDRPVVGDRHRLGPVELVVRELRGERVSRVGLRLAPESV